MTRLALRIRIWWLGTRLAALDRDYVDAFEKSQDISDQISALESVALQLKARLMVEAK